MNKEWAQPWIEPFLIQVLRRVKPELVKGGASPELLHDVDLFCMQEGQHYEQHEKFNRVLRDAGYERVEAEERRIAADYARCLRKEPEVLSRLLRGPRDVRADDRQLLLP